MSAFIDGIELVLLGSGKMHAMFEKSTRFLLQVRLSLNFSKVMIKCPDGHKAVATTFHPSESASAKLLKKDWIDSSSFESKASNKIF